MATGEVDVKELAQGITFTLKIRRVRQWAWRMNIALWLIRLAAWVMWVNVDIEVVDDDL